MSMSDGDLDEPATPSGPRPSQLHRLTEPTSQGDKVMAAIRAAIQDGRLAPGSLHSAKSLAEQLGVSRTPVREALLQLARDGSVRLERNRGARIAETSLDDLASIFQLRMWLELPATRLAAQVRTSDDIDSLAQRLSVLERDRDELTESEIRRQDHNFHVTLMEITGNERLAQFIDTLRGSVLVHGEMNTKHRRLHSVVVEEHRTILEAIRLQDTDAAEAAMRMHLEATLQVLTERGSQRDQSTADTGAASSSTRSAGRTRPAPRSRTAATNASRR